MVTVGELVRVGVLVCVRVLVKVGVAVGGIISVGRSVKVGVATCARTGLDSPKISRTKTARNPAWGRQRRPKWGWEPRLSSFLLIKPDFKGIFVPPS